MWDAESGMIDNWHKYCQRQMRDNYHTLDEQLIFANTPVKKESYASKRLPYVLEPGNIDAYDELMQTLYSPEEREKIEWCIGSIVNGDSKTIQKFMVLYGPPGSGKSTVLNIIQKLFTGYYAAFDSQALGSASNAFSLEAFKANPLIAIQHEGNLSKIEDNTRLNSLVSHETMMVNEKFRSAYANQFKSFLILATNKPVKITDAKSGLIRRLIDVVPTGEKVPQKRYSELYAKTDFELGGIAWHCKEVYEANKHRYDDYIPTRMLGASNDFYNFMLDRYYIFKKEDGISLKRAWAMYDEYIEDKQVQQALQDASRAQSTADGKVRCFSAQPYPPYEVGDLWVQGGSGDNTISPVNMSEFEERRLQLDKALECCNVLQDELNYIAKVLPADKNKYARIVLKLEKDFNLIKKLRQSDNGRFLPHIQAAAKTE